MLKRLKHFYSLNHIMQRHRRRVIAVLLTLLLLIILLIASIVLFPTRQLNEEPTFNAPTVPLGSQAPAELPAPSAATTPPPAPAIPTAPPALEVTVLAGDSLAKIFNRLQLNQKQLHAISQLPMVKPAISKLRPGQVLSFVIDENKHLQQLTIPLSSTENLLISRMGTGFSTTMETAATTITNKIAHATITSTFYAAGNAANIPRSALTNFINIFQETLDFQRTIHHGDRFAIKYQMITNTKTAKTHPGDIVAASYTHKKKTYYAFLFKDKSGRNTYYSEDGANLRQAFMRRPVYGSKISSPFSLHRFDPILKIVRAHTGTDFSAPYGTPIHATGDGQITLQGRKGGYGRCIVINHGRGITTLYAHMSRFSKKYKVGSYVKMGDVIGYIGSSGWSTGPHVHYEFRVNNQYKNPMTVKLPNGPGVPANQMANFKAVVKAELVQLNPPAPSQNTN